MTPRIRPVTGTRQGVLIGEFEREFAEMLASLLDSWGHPVVCAGNVRATWDLLTTFSPDLLLVPMSHGDVRCREFLRELRAKGDATAVIVVGGPRDVAYKVDVLQMGADDYLVRPLDIAELAARVQAVLRRSSMRTLLRFGGRLAIDPASHRLTVDGNPTLLSPRQFGLAWMLAIQCGRHVSSAELTRAVLGADSTRGRAELYVLVSALRRKLASLGATLKVETGNDGYALTLQAKEARPESPSTSPSDHDPDLGGSKT